MGSHIDPGTGRNRREGGKLRARIRRAEQARQAGEKPPLPGGLRYRAGQPAEKRVTWRQRERVRRGR
jgi:hypothetical protein